MNSILKNDQAWLVWVLLLALLLLTVPVQAQPAQHKSVILAIGAHAGDMEVAAGALLAREVRLGNRVVILHLTLGEGGNPKLSPEVYAEQKRREAQEAAKILGAEVVFGPFRDGEIPNDDTARRFVAEVIRDVRPAYIITHWKNSLHRDHSVTSLVVSDALLLASLESVITKSPVFRGVRRIYFTENWEDKEGFVPYTYVDVAEDMGTWEKAVKQYEFVRGGISNFPYFKYYSSLASVRGAESGFEAAECFDIESFGKKQMLSSLP